MNNVTDNHLVMPHFLAQLYLRGYKRAALHRQFCIISFATIIEIRSACATFLLNNPLSVIVAAQALGNAGVSCES